jgi:hypothetical protein
MNKYITYIVFCDVTLCSLVESDYRFGGTYPLHLHGTMNLTIRLYDVKEITIIHIYYRENLKRQISTGS